MSTTHYADDDTLKYIGELEDALCLALPYVESAESDPAYKPGVVAIVTRRLRAVLAKSE